VNNANIALIGLAVLFGLLLIANLVLALVVIMKLRGRGESSVVQRGWNRSFLHGWKYPDLRLYMIGWTFVGILLSVVFCILMVVILTM